LKFFDKYYLVLELPPDSADPEIKAAYRRMAKMYHPDRSGDESTRAKFVEVNEAYEILINRHAYIQDAIRRYRQKQAGPTRAPSRTEVRKRAETHADMQFEKFAKTPIYKTAMVMNSAADYIFLFIGVFMIFSPIGAYFSDMDKAARKGEDPEFHVFPVLVGIVFLYGVWYFIFKSKEEQ
jgi:hypothetical protein